MVQIVKNELIVQIEELIVNEDPTTTVDPTINEKTKINVTPTSNKRYQYFQIEIFSNLGDTKTNLWIDSNDLIPLLIKNNLVSIMSLERKFSQFEFLYEKKRIKLHDFSGQLERRKENGALFWNIIIETIACVTGTRIRDYLLKSFSKKKKQTQSKSKSPSSFTIHKIETRRTIFNQRSEMVT